MVDFSIKKFDSMKVRLSRGFLPYIWLAVILTAAYLIFSPHVRLLGSSSSGTSINTPYIGDPGVRLWMALLVFAITIIMCVLYVSGNLTCSRMVTAFIAAGIVMRAGTMLYTPFFIHGHDIGAAGSSGHFGYMFYIYTHMSLPTSNSGLFYHPPLEHLLCAAVAKCYALVTGVTDVDTVFEAARLVPCFASCALLIVVCRLFNEFGLSVKVKAAAMAIMAFHPAFYILSASINNDMLMVFFMMTAFLYTVRWYRKQTYKNILMTAVATGCAMSTKLSGAAIAFFTGAVFLIVFIRGISNGGVIPLIRQFSAFAAVCFPLGLWYPIRNLLLFHQPLGYVLQLAKTNDQYIGNIPFVDRFLSFSLPACFNGQYCNPHGDHMLWVYTVKCSLFGEFTFPYSHAVTAKILIAANLCLIAVSLVSMVWLLFSRSGRDRFAVICLSALWAIQVISFVSFNIKYPFGCTMDFRYIVPTAVTGAAFVGLFYEKAAKKGGIFPAALREFTFIATTAFAVSSICFYIM